MEMYNRIENIKILTRTKNALKTLGVEKVKDFEKITFGQLLGCRGIGQEALIELLELIQLVNVKLKSEYS